jgi:hypothetical protein
LKKEIVAAIILTVILTGTLINTWALENMTQELTDLADDAEYCAEAGNWDGAIEKALEAQTKWNNADGYTHIVVRHAEIDSTTDAFYDFMKALYSEEPGNAKGAHMLLIAHLESIAGMEKIKFGSIF